ncbi:hypothetical protein CSAL01_09102 [Colletotrichum salicis]|uniref:Uncharacterized protein n=1 Tax=Colletotrichum salicis TaxID=1209931 RepID=A0A135V339_9PEZI|nr:hypothetical protein CSAL01_09102 [Colletotrichum salicis]
MRCLPRRGTPTDVCGAASSTIDLTILGQRVKRHVQQFCVVRPRTVDSEKPTCFLIFSQRLAKFDLHKAHRDVLSLSSAPETIAPESAFLFLPRETADISGSTDGHLDIIKGLMAEEMRGLALRKDTITFSTVTSVELRTLALNFDMLVRDLDCGQEYLFYRAGYTIPDIAHDKLRLAYPQFASLLEDLRQEYPRIDTLKRRGPFGEAPSQYQTFCKEALAASSITNVPNISERHYIWADAMRGNGGTRIRDAFQTAQCSVNHWVIPSKEVMDNRIMEALALAPAGMPPASFSLVLNGQPPAPQLCAEMFQMTIQRDVAWQAAWFASVDQGIVPPREWFLHRSVVFGNLQVSRRTGYFYRGFPRAMRDIVLQRSIVRCNFDPGKLWNADRLVQDHRTWTPEQWQEA